MDVNIILEKLKQYGVGRRKLDDDLFASDKPPPRLGVYEDEENLCPIIKSTCNISRNSNKHCNPTHKYYCSQCRKALPSPHLLDLHIQETHDSFFAVMAAKKPSAGQLGCEIVVNLVLISEYWRPEEVLTIARPRAVDCAALVTSFARSPSIVLFVYSGCCARPPKAATAGDSIHLTRSPPLVKYCCYIEECKEKFIDADERLNHCVKIHKLPKDFRFDQKPKKESEMKKKYSEQSETSMDVDTCSSSQGQQKKFTFSNSKQKTFTKYAGRKFTDNKSEESADVNMEAIINDLKNNLPLQ